MFACYQFKWLTTFIVLPSLSLQGPETDVVMGR
jgi:hypothetical protein